MPWWALGAGVRAMGGQAVVNGVMMRGEDRWAVAVRRMDGSITVATHRAPSWADRWRRVPVVRGVAAFAESMALGMKALLWSSTRQLDDQLAADAAETSISEATPEAADAGSDSIEEGAGQGDAVSGAPAGSQDGAGSDRVTTIVLGVTLAVSLALFTGLFILAPTIVIGHGGRRLGLEGTWLTAAEGAGRVGLLLAYLALLGRTANARTLFAYHGAEHKTIAAGEAGAQLVDEQGAVTAQAVAQARVQSRAHVRCGTNFLLVVMLTSVIVYSVVGRPAWPILLASRLILLPVIVGLAYEVIRLASRHLDRPWVRRAMAPGLALQSLTTREPDDEQLAVALEAWAAAGSDRPLALVSSTPDGLGAGD